MLLKLSISNFAIIKNVVFEPLSGLNIITGETGAGKSIILDALNLILGSRADIKTQSEWGEKCIVEGEFALNASQYKSVFKELDIDFEEVTIIRREINTNGKTRTFINDTPVSLQQLRVLTSSLVSIHSQHENTQLTDKEFQFDLLDTHAGNNAILEAYQSDYRKFINNKQSLNDLINQQERLLKEKDYLSFLISEFETADLKTNEEQMLEQEAQVLGNSEQIGQISNYLIDSVSESEQSVISVLNQIRTRFRSIEGVNESFSEIAKRLQSVILELKDISSETTSLRDSVQADPLRLEQINERLNLIQNLKRKHGVSDYAELLKVSETLADQLLDIGHIDQKIEELQKQNSDLERSLLKQAEKLHKNRISASVGLKKELESLLKNLEMPNAKLEFDLSTIDELNHYGNSELSIRFTANLGMPAQLLNKVASGGELSRLALCIRVLEAGQKHLSSLVFDEIDTGVSGKVADNIGKMFKRISQSHQVIAITHLPQVAGYGDAHFMVGKKEEKNTTVSTLKQLKQEERVEELAKMLSGNESTDIAKKNAEELLKTGHSV